MGWRITDDQWETLRRARRSRPKPAKALGGFILTFGALGVVIGLVTPNLFVVAFFGMMFAVQAFVRHNASAPWDREFAAKRRSRGRRIVLIPGSESIPSLHYQMIRDRPLWEWLAVEVNRSATVKLEPEASPIGDPVFDQSLGLAGTDNARALLGPTLRTMAPTWHADAGFIIVSGQAKLKLGSQGYEDRGTLQDICAAFGDYVDRLTAPPKVGLATLARDLIHPFDAARAFAKLSTDWPDKAEDVRIAIADTNIGPALTRVAQSGQGLLDPAFDWPTRSAIGRGVLGVDGVASNTLATWLETQSPADAAGAMALVELCEAGAALRGRTMLRAQAAADLTWLVDHGGPECLAWMHARARHDKPSRLGLKTLSARLEGQHGGLLSLEDDTHAGALSETRAGELSITGGAPPA
jgi:hypothetical protein